MSIQVAFSDIARRDSSAAYTRDFMIDRVSTDTRTLQSGDIYLALTGKYFDGHHFIDAAIEAGASAIVVSQYVEADIPVLTVGNTLYTLGVIARLYRDQLSATVFAITGSNGKTTVKGMLAAVCKKAGKASVTVANNNNQIGVPLTLLSASREDQYLVIEAGTSERGEIEKLVGIINPDVVLITNISESHLSGLGSRDDVFEEKSELVSGSGVNSKIIVNLDDDYAAHIIKRAGSRSVITFGFSDSADIYLSGESTCQMNHVTHGDKTYQFTLQLLGNHNLYNAMAVIGMADVAGISIKDIQVGLESYTGDPGRLQARQLSDNRLLIDDTYNANPSSSYVALEVLGSYEGRKLFVYGGMAELGRYSVDMHRSVGEKANEVHVDQLYIYGREARPVYDIFMGEKYFFDEIDNLSHSLSGHFQSGDTVLIKGSRCFRMERVSEHLLRGAA